MGEVTAILPEGKASLLTIATPFSQEVKEGDSVAANGACLTVLTQEAGALQFRLMDETLKRTNLGKLSAHSHVNLERPVAAGERFDGHFVMGHVDGIAEIIDIKVVGPVKSPTGAHGASDKIFTFKFPQNLLPYFIEKGSVTLDGVSLTVVKVFEDTFTVSMMPYTLQHTTFGESRVRDAVNIEVDMIGKYVERYMDLRSGRSR